MFRTRYRRGACDIAQREVDPNRDKTLPPDAKPETDTATAATPAEAAAAARPDPNRDKSLPPA